MMRGKAFALAIACCCACGSTERRAPLEVHQLPQTARVSAVDSGISAPALPGGRLIRATELLGRDYLRGDSVQVLADGTTIVGGVYKQTIDFGGGELPTFWDQEPTSYGLPASRQTALGLFVAAFAGTGEHLLSKGWGPSFSGYERTEVAGSSQHSLVIALEVKGEIALEGKPVRSKDQDVFVVRLGGDGAPTASHRVGGRGDQRCFALAVDESGNPFLAGDFEQEIDFGSKKLQGSGAFVAKLAPDGRLLSSRVLGQGTALGLALAPNGSVVVVGDFPIGSGSVVELDAAGAQTWERRLETAPGGSASVVAVAVTPDGGVAIAGSYYGKPDFPGLKASDSEAAFLAMLDRDGRPLWAHALDSAGHDRSGGVAVDARGNVAWTGYCAADAVVAGVSVSCSDAGMNNAFVATFAPAGNARWVRAFGDDQPQSGDAITFGPTGDVLVVVNGYGKFQVDDAAFDSGIQHSWLLRFAP